MKSYFQLQVRMLNRHFIDFGIPPFLAYIILIVVFISGSVFLFEKLADLALYIYTFSGISMLLKLNERKRNTFLKIAFKTKEYLRLRIAENLVIVLPFITFLFFKKAYFYGLILGIATFFLAYITFEVPINYSIPTPFGKYPFEFPIGFRKTFFLFPITYFLTYISVTVQNFNLGIFSLLVLFFITASFYSKTEEAFYVWIFKKNPEYFLKEKIKIGVVFSTLLSLPIIIIITVFFENRFLIVIIITVLCLIYVSQSILAKYAEFPNQKSLPSVILFVLSISFPPFLVITLPYFYNKSLTQLKQILND